MSETTPTPTPVLLVGVDFGRPHFDAELAELSELVTSAGLEPVAKLVCKRKAPDAALFVGSGKAEEIAELVTLHQAKEVIFDQALSPAQQRNLERFLKVPVYDRIYLILEIFAQRARSHEGKLQVQLARLQYLSTRLVRRWSHLERQRGGIGTRGGPGEAQIELDKRMIAQSIQSTKKRLAQVQKQRQTQRRQRTRNQTFDVSLVGYTNAGKSTLFNALVKAGTYAANQLFATLDTTTRQMFVPETGRSLSLSDTVGFIRDIPHGLIDAFKATLQEAVDADLLLHVVDASNPEHVLQIEEVHRVLEDIGAAHIPMVLVFNKSDLIEVDPDGAGVPAVVRDQYEVDGQPRTRLHVSAVTGQGLDVLREELAGAFALHLERIMTPEVETDFEDDVD